MRSSIIVLLLLTATAVPEWLFTLQGCRHLSTDQIAQFDREMDEQLKGCSAIDNAISRRFVCGNGGVYIYFFTRDRCEEAVKQYRKDHTF